MKKTLCLVLTLMMAVSLLACAAPTAEPDVAPVADPADPAVAEPSSDENVTIEFFSTFPDRTSGRGLWEETCIQNFVAEHPNVTVETEFLADDPYKVKIQTYMAANDVPDVFFAWSASNYMTPLINGNFIVPLNSADYDSYNFMAGAREAFTYDGILYGLPSQEDFWVMYFNEKIFEENNVAIPTNWDEWLTAVKAFNDAGVTPIALNGGDKWSLVVVWQNIIDQLCAGPEKVRAALAGDITFSDTPEFAEALKLFREMIDANGFQQSFLTADEATAQNLFTSGQAAMYLWGSWSMSMAEDQQISEDVRTHIRAAKVPCAPNAAGSSNDICLNYGAGYVVGVNEDENVQKYSKMLLDYMLSPENYAKFNWENGILIPVEKFDQFLTGSENQLQKDLMGIISDATTASGSWICDSLTNAFKTECENLMHQWATGMLDDADFLAQLDALAEQER